jgi:Exostosin family
MATVHLLSAAPAGPERAHLDLKCLQASARIDRFGVHHAVDRPEDAQLILFVETSVHAGHYFERVKRHPLYRARPGDCYLYCSTDRFVPMLPGVYAAVERSWYWPAWTRPGHYVNVIETGLIRYDPAPAERKYLYSFIGAAQSSAVRRRVLTTLRRPDALLVDTQLRSLDRGDLTQEDYERRYVDSVRASAFVLCPAGYGPSSFRLFESMMLGRAPVIISDEWVAPIGPDWESCSIRVAQDELEVIPELLRRRSADATAMGEAARAVWLDWFSEAVSFHRVVESCLELVPFAPQRTGIRRLRPYRQLLRPYLGVRYLAKKLGHGRGKDT